MRNFIKVCLKYWNFMRKFFSSNSNNSFRLKLCVVHDSGSKLIFYFIRFWIINTLIFLTNLEKFLNIII